MSRKISESAAKYDPVPFDPAQYAAGRSRKDPVFRKAFRALEDEFAALDALMEVRRAAGLTQAELARRMGMKPSALARIESSLVSRKHAPTLTTLRRYADACGLKLSISIGKVTV